MGDVGKAQGAVETSPRRWASLRGEGGFSRNWCLSWNLKEGGEITSVMGWCGREGYSRLRTACTRVLWQECLRNRSSHAAGGERGRSVVWEGVDRGRPGDMSLAGSRKDRGWSERNRTPTGAFRERADEDHSGCSGVGMFLVFLVTALLRHNSHTTQSIPVECVVAWFLVCLWSWATIHHNQF